ncbi:unnamed protein product [Blepharisma stoltei]|uniref:Beta-galactosidase n=1 Tax=Blepharisma stoltei TaxID=1481888 RepID=A0AAU9K8R1_9CILI|nr:unnamed protein product [Blepharisma stoltei]
MRQYFVLVALLAFLSPASAGYLEVVSDESWTVEGRNYIGNAVGTWVHSLWASVPGAKWIWKSYLIENPTAEESYAFQKEFNVAGFPTSSFLTFSADNSYAIFLNGNFIGASQDLAYGGRKTVTFDLLSRTIQGRNVVQVVVLNWAQAGSGVYDNPAGLLFKLAITYN